MIAGSSARLIAMSGSNEEKLDRLVELCWQGEDSCYTRDKELTDWEVGEEFVTLSKEVASYYRPLVEKLVEARIMTVSIIPLNMTSFPPVTRPAGIVVSATAVLVPRATG